MFKCCAFCQTEFEIDSLDLDFYSEVSPVFDGKKELIPPPVLCPMCRLRRRMSFRNQMFVHVRLSDHTGKPIFSGYDEEAPCPVVEKDFWFSDAFDPLKAGVDVDFSQPFFEQLAFLAKKVPQPSLAARN